MLKEYIYENLKEISTELDKINEAYKKNEDEQSILKTEIRKIQEESDIDFEIFSPRNAGNIYKNKVNTMGERLQELRKEETKLREKKAEYEEKKDLFKKLKEDFDCMEAAIDNIKKQTVSRDNKSIEQKGKMFHVKHFTLWNKKYDFIYNGKNI